MNNCYILLDLAKRISEGSKKSAIFFLSTWNFYLREIVFVTDVGVLTIETFSIKRKACVLTRISQTVSAVSFLKTLGYLHQAFEIREKGTSAKKVTLVDAKEDVDKICKICMYKRTSDNVGGKRTRSFSLQHKIFIALNYAQDLGTSVKESLKRSTSSKWPTLTEK